MRQLRLVGLAEDGASLVLEAPTGDTFRLPVDERLRAACRGDLIRLGQIEIETESPLRPREIQARVRAGESAEQVAASSGMPLDRVLRFASPMLQERERVVAQARATRPRPRAEETLADLVEERLVGRGTHAATLRWDAWRREDGRWTVQLRWRHAAEHSASWTFDLGRRSLQPDDPAAEQLVAEEFHARTITAVTPLAAAAKAAHADPHAGSRPVAADAGERAPRRPGSPRAGVGEERRAGEPPQPGQRGRATEPSAGAPGPSPRQRVDRSSRRPGRRDPRTGSAPSSEGGDDTEGEAPRRVAAGGGADVTAEPTDDERGRRTPVPSWDDILLGVRRRH